MKDNKVFSAVILTAVAAIWGSAFLSMKGTLERLDVNSFLAWRFTIATLFLIAIRPSVLKKFDLPFIKKGAILGIFLGSGYIFQSFGLTLTTVSNTGFITGLYVVLTPIVAAVILRKNITLVEWFAVLVATAGLALLSFNGFEFGLGEFLVLVSALLFAFHIGNLNALHLHLEKQLHGSFDLRFGCVLNYPKYDLVMLFPDVGALLRDRRGKQYLHQTLILKTHLSNSSNFATACFVRITFRYSIKETGSA